MAILTQSHFPRLWLLMQNVIGGNASKQKLATKYYHGQKHILEIGCSVGNISSAFCKFPDIIFTGIDIDSEAIKLAKQRFKNIPNFQFSLSSLNQLSKQGKTFDYVVFAGILHHIDDQTGFMLLQDAIKCTADNGILIIYEPEALKPSDNSIFRFFYSNFEQGKFLRSRTALQELVESAGIDIEVIEDHLISPGIVKRPYVARFNLLVGKPKIINAV